MSLFRSLAGALGSTYDYLTPGKGSSRLTDYGGWGDSQPTAPKSTPTPSYQTGSSIDTSAYDKAIADQSATIDSLKSQLASMPKLPSYDSTAAWATAQKNAQNVVNPVYLDKLNQYLEGRRLQQSQMETKTARDKKQIQTDLNQTLEDTATARQRAAEDANTSIADTNATEGEYQTQNGTAFDRARRALLESFGNFGSSGLVSQQDAQAITDRNAEEKAQTRQFNKERQATETLRTRTFADLGKTEERAQGSAKTRTEQANIDLKNFIDNANLDEKNFRTTNELERQNEILNQTKNQYSIGFRDFMNALVQKGARPQDIALAQQVYGA